MSLVERGFAPDPAIRMGIRQLLKMRIKELGKNPDFFKKEIIQELRSQPIAVNTKEANEQHYELPSEFFQLALGKRLKYSSAFYEKGAPDLNSAEEDMLKLYMERAGLKDGQEILELGCGWGSLSLYMAEKLPGSKITVVSNSSSQKAYIDRQAQLKGFGNLQVITADMNQFSIDRQFDRVISIEMFEHMRNYQKLFGQVSNWLKKDGRLFLHIFCHKDSSYFFETEGENNWMGRYFFTGGIMPSFDLFENAQSHLTLIKKWKVGGKNYQRTSEDWLKNMDRAKDKIMPIMAKTYGPENAKVWFNRWRIFFAACAELFGYRDGNEWFVGHYLFGR
jgi:cyclopropane-fatty-acyl-phospholipid synthase